jgi:acyl-CoA reductase-like NAD-dependent aldehyde dehydrogenase
MSLTADRTSAAPVEGATTFESLNPATGEVVATLPIHTEADVRAALARAREAAVWWQSLGYDGRKRRLQRWQAVLTRRRTELLDLIHRENGKPLEDGYIELWLALEHLGWGAANAARVLGPRRAKGPAALLNHHAVLEYHPYGVIGVIGPWNYPLFTPMGSIAYALAAGNAVIFKPSEYTPAIGVFLAETMAEVCPEQPVLQTLTGFGATGAALVNGGVDKIAFTGSPATGRKIYAEAAKTLTPVLMELGGKDALIVDDDGDVERAAAAAIWGGCFNAGQTCAGVERVYVTESVYDRFVAEAIKVAQPLRASDDPKGSLGPITMPGQVDIIERHVRDALDRGARAVVGGLESIRRPYVDPIVLVDVPDDAAVMREETFGPVVPISRVKDIEEAISKANATAYGLGSAVFAKRRGMEIARRLRAGMTSVNAVLSFPAFGTLPFGGVGESGFGRIHGEDGLREFVWPKAISRQRFRVPAELMTFDRPGWLVGVLQKVDDLRYRRR